MDYSEGLSQQITNFMESTVKEWQKQSPAKVVKLASFGNLYLLDDLRFRLDDVEITNDEFPKICDVIQDGYFPETVIDFSDDCEEYPFMNECYDIYDFLQDLENWI